MQEANVLTASGTGYLHPDYAASLSEFGTPRHLSCADGWVLERPISGTSYRDAMGCYPLFDCADWSKLPDDLSDPEHDWVSLTIVSAPFGPDGPDQLRQAFDRVSFFKDHFVADVMKPIESFVKRSHQKSVRRAFRDVTVRVCPTPSDRLDDWTTLFGHLVERHNITGLRAFSREAFERQLSIPGMVMFESRVGDEVVGLDLWYVQGQVAYGHLVAFNELGYDTRASYASKWFMLNHFAEHDTVRWVDLGGGAGGNDDSDGLTKFKKGWSTGTRPVYLCGKTFRPDVYDTLVHDRGIGETDYFPAYREGELL